MTKDEMQIPQRFLDKAMQRLEHWKEFRGNDKMQAPHEATGKFHSAWHQTDLSLALELMIQIPSLDTE